MEDHALAQDRGERLQAPTTNLSSNEPWRDPESPQPPETSPGSLFSLVFLGHPAHRKAFCTPRRREKFLEAAGFLGLSTARCLIDSSLELEDAPLDLAPRHGLPFIPMTDVMAHDFSTLLEDSLVDDHCSPVGVSLVLPWALASGEIPAPARVRVCVGLLTGVRACGGFPSPCLACDAPVRVPLSAGCTMDGYCTYFDRAALATGLARRPWHRAHFGPSSACVSLVTCDDGSSVVSLALPMGSFA